MAKNAGLGFAIPYLDNGEAHDYEPDFIIRLARDANEYLMLETKGYDPKAEIKRQAAERWVSAVNGAKPFGTWRHKVLEISDKSVSVRINSGSSSRKTGAALRLR